MITILTDESLHESVKARAAADGLWLPAGEAEAATGWTLKPEGFCKGEVCLPVPPKRSAEFVNGDEINVARALVNLVEVYEGYASHFDYAVGLLVKAEECTVVNDLRDIATAVREIRVKLMVAGPAGIPEAVKDLGSLVEGGAVACGHLLEALRELPELPPLKDTYTVDDLRGMIASVVADYFTVEEPEKKGGE